jgi:hypothetical protein
MKPSGGDVQSESEEEKAKNHLFSGFSKNFTTVTGRRKGACVTSGGIFIDLSGVCCVFLGNNFLINNFLKRSAIEIIKRAKYDFIRPV